MTMKEKMARALATGAYENMLNNAIPLNVEVEEFVDQQWPNWMPRVELVLDAMSGDPGHDITAAVLDPMENRREVLRIWDGLITAAKEGK